MVKVLAEQYPNSEGYYLDGILVSNLNALKQAVKDDWDGVMLIDGAEGSGKSVLTQQVGKYLDPTLDLSRVVFTPEDFVKAVTGAKQYQCVIYDEAFGGLSSRKTMSETNHTLVSMLTEIRQKNLFIMVVLPTFFDVDKYVALWRSRCLLHVYAKQFQRGFFRFYNFSSKKYMYVNGKKFYDYKCGKADFYGRFTNFYPCGKEEYKLKKAESLGRYNKEERLGTREQKYYNIVKYLAKQKKEAGMTQEEIAKLFNNEVERSTIGRMLSKPI